MARPRTVIPEPDEMIKLGEEMLDWVANNEPIHLSQWYSGEKFFTDHIWDCMLQAKEFTPYYERALKLVGYNYLLKESPIEPSLKQRWQRVYFKDLRKQEDGDLQLKLDLEKKSLEEKVSIYEDKFNAVIDQLDSLQRNKPDNNNSNDHKS